MQTNCSFFQAKQPPVLQGAAAHAPVLPARQCLVQADWVMPPPGAQHRVCQTHVCVLVHVQVTKLLFDHVWAGWCSLLSDILAALPAALAAPAAAAPPQLLLAFERWLLLLKVACSKALSCHQSEVACHLAESVHTSTPVAHLPDRIQRGQTVSKQQQA